ncbi:hypothetical protein HELRODRAFT_176691 [Helobdella robusta]|uniref:Uncharacterized protein n=1 Tax=Helobdella robusta TaxID=6412 RepID=T1FAS4_HELRO|nr:hypothetical protein HELRODRAFT_176691 [Helobdella robusta]ESN99527.1 hypothetical protein HELRODRAFT_176691 [Helobdella robusta]
MFMIGLLVSFVLLVNAKSFPDDDADEQDDTMAISEFEFLKPIVRQSRSKNNGKFVSKIDFDVVCRHCAVQPFSCLNNVLVFSTTSIFVTLYIRNEAASSKWPMKPLDLLALVTN